MVPIDNCDETAEKLAPTAADKGISARQQCELVMILLSVLSALICKSKIVLKIESDKLLKGLHSPTRSSWHHWGLS